MAAQDFLDLEISLILLKYGRRAALQAIARKSQVPEAALLREFDDLLSAQKNARPKKRRGVKPFILDSVLAGNETKAIYLRALHSRFENRTFLPELKDVKRFFERYGRPVQAWKSRMLAEGSVFRLLASLDIYDLKKLVAETPVHKGVSSLGLISDEILGRNKPGRK
jgi:hypothetical protein